ncbi:hypothetical protein [Floccifex sp.]|uniref:hypothetical protein n=1 Tax=Floccifex sp. TaxID=2815810 RepID=UPI003F009186
MEYRISNEKKGVFIEIFDSKEGWLPLFGANIRKDFVGMPTCWPFDARSNPKGSEKNILLLDIDLLTMKKTFQEIKTIVENETICSVPEVTFMSSISNKEGNVLHIIPGQGYKYYEKPKYQILTNYSPFKMDSLQHPWMGWDRYQIAKEILEKATDEFDVDDCFKLLKKVSQEVCPTVVSMVLDVTEEIVYWCENRDWSNIKKRKLAY